MDRGHPLMRLRCRLAVLLTAALLCGCSMDTANESAAEPVHLYSGRNKSELRQAIYQAAQCFEPTVTVSGDPDSALLTECCNQVSDEHPELFWFGGWNASESDGDTTKITLEVPALSRQHRLLYMQQELLDAADVIKAEIPEDASDYDKALAVHDYIIYHAAYDAEAEEGGNAYGCLVGHRAHCEGYSKAFLLLMNQLGIPAGICSGKTDTGGHVWNYVQLGGKYYWVDLTWDDPIRENPAEDAETHGLCFVNDAILRHSHTLTQNQGFIPECSSMEMNYYVRNGWFFESYEHEAVAEAIRSQMHEKHIEIMFDECRDVDTAVHFLFTEQGFWTLEGLDADFGSVTYTTFDAVPLLRMDAEHAPAAGETAPAETNPA
ncbi:MAG: hypothetical protein J6P20_05780 [Oscillospiraceae bacterium]|nr:hypothetical protein [Oscillospiraceae bacterium]